MNITKSHVKYLIVGGGPAALAAARAVRALDPRGAMLMVSADINRPYDRTRLSKDYLARKLPRAGLFAVDAGWFSAADVQLRTGRRLMAIDAPRRRITLDSGDELAFDRLLLATGAVPVHLDVPGAALPGVHYLRTLEEADRLRIAMDAALAHGRRHDGGRGRVLVAGGGLLGFELACVLAGEGLHVDWVIGAAHPLADLLSPAAGRHLADVARGRGIAVHEGVRLRSLAGDGRVQQASTDAATLEVDFVVAAIGVRAARDFLRGTDVAVERAILTDDHCRTNVPDVFAAGDAAAAMDPILGKHRIVGHWGHAIAAGDVAGRNMAGEPARLEGVTQFSSAGLGLALHFFGESRLAKRRVMRGLPGEAGYAEFGVGAGGQVVSVASIGAVDESAAMGLVRNRVDAERVAGQLADAGVPLAAIG